ncbi:MAG TPA: tetratricopeptide repeat protein [Verrucomicrobiales bacterium]|nr:tetratricopeptide repeat protein [Verrucomicrobiales bacterium]
MIFDPGNWQYILNHPWMWLVLAFQIWMMVDAFRRGEWIWFVLLLIFLGSGITPLLYYFFVYRTSGPMTRVSGGGGPAIEIPGHQDRKHIKELEAQIELLDKAHHYSELGDIFLKQGKSSKAEECYLGSLERDPDDLDTKAHLGRCLLQQEKIEESMRCLQEVFDENSDHDYGQTALSLAEAKQKSGQNGEAIEVIAVVLENHSYAEAHIQLAELYLLENDKEKARGYLNEVVLGTNALPEYQKKRDAKWIRKAKKLLQSL